MSAHSNVLIPAGITPQQVERSTFNSFSASVIRLVPEDHGKESISADRKTVKIQYPGIGTEEKYEVFGGGDPEAHLKHLFDLDEALSKLEYKQGLEDIITAGKLLEEKMELHKISRPVGDDEKKPASDDAYGSDNGLDHMWDSSDEDESEDEHDDDTQPKRKQQKAATPTKVKKKTTRASTKASASKDDTPDDAAEVVPMLTAWVLRQDKLIRRMSRASEAVEVMIKKFFATWRSLLSAELRQALSDIIREVCSTSNWTDPTTGIKHTTPRGYTPEAFRIARKKFMLLAMAEDAAEQTESYIMYDIKLDGNSPWDYKLFHERVLQILSYLPYLPCLADTEEAVSGMERYDTPMSGYKLCTLLLRAVPATWKHDFELNREHACTDPAELKRKMIKIQAARRSRRRVNDNDQKKTKSKKSKETSQQSGNKRPSGDSLGLPRIPKKQRTTDCELCTKHGGKAKTHTTNDCRKWDKDGNLLSSFKSKQNRNKANFQKANYAQLSEQVDTLTKALKKASKKQKKKHKSKRRSVSSSDEDSSDSDE